MTNFGQKVKWLKEETKPLFFFTKIEQMPRVESRVRHFQNAELKSGEYVLSSDGFTLSGSIYLVEGKTTKTHPSISYMLHKY